MIAPISKERNAHKSERERKFKFILQAKSPSLFLFISLSLSLEYEMMERFYCFIHRLRADPALMRCFPALNTFDLGETSDLEALRHCSQLTELDLQHVSSAIESTMWIFDNVPLLRELWVKDLKAPALKTLLKVRIP